MKRNFFIYIGILGASILLGHYRPGFVSTMIFYMMVCLLLAEILMIAITYVAFKISHGINRRNIIKGETVHYELDIVNPTFLLFAPLKVYYTGSDILFKQSNLQENNDLIMYPLSKEQYSKEIVCDYRGSYYIGVERVEIRGFFGMFLINYSGMETLKILVYPTIYELKPVRFHHALSESSESVISFDKYDKSIFSELRDYQPGDSLNRIHWNLSAKRNELVTKEFEGNVNNRTQIYINTEISRFTYEQNVVIEDYLIEGAVALSKFLLSNSTETELHWYNDKGDVVRGGHDKDFKDFYEVMAVMSFNAQAGSCRKLLMDTTGGQHDQCVLVLFSAKLTVELAEELIRKKRQGYEVNLVTLPLSHLEIGGETVDLEANPIYRLMDRGIRVYHLTFEEGVCRMEVA